MLASSRMMGRENIFYQKAKMCVYSVARELCARRRVSEANRTAGPALRPEMAALPRNKL